MYEYTYEQELYHYGVKGMKWGHRKAQPLAVSDTRKRYDEAKAKFKTANKAYNNAYNKAHSYSEKHFIGQYINKNKSAEADRRWGDAIDKAGKAHKAKVAYKQAKAERKQAIKDTYKKVDSNATIKDRFLYNDATRKKAAKYMVDNNMSMKDANERAKGDAKRNTAAILGVYGAITVASLYAANKH